MPVIDTQSLSIAIMTYNEEENIGRCLESVAGLGDEILVLDSYSTDRTVEIALEHGARVEQHTFENFIAQRKRLIEKASHDWILLLDADEYLSPQMRSSIILLKSNPVYDVYSCNRLNRIGNTLIRHGSWYPDRKFRYFDRRKIISKGEDPHDTIEPLEGASVSHLAGDLMHYADADMSSRFQSIERHSTRAAAALYEKGQKWALWRLMLKPAIRFFVSYFIRFGLLDGYYGWFIARSEAQYVWMREVKLWELWRRKMKEESGKA